MPKILVADDSPLQLTLLQTALQEKGFEVVVAKDALQASMAVRRTAPDAIVLDINMPGGSGVDVLKRLKSSVKTKSIPVVIVSGSQDAAIKKEVLELGVGGFFAKPVDVEELGKALSDLLSVGH